MKSRYIKLIILEILIILSMLFSSFVLNIIKNTLFQTIYWFIVFIILRLILGYEKDKNMLRKKMLLDVFVYVIIYISIEYFLGLFTGYLLSPYSHDIIHLLKNITPIILIITFQELSRYIIISKGRDNKKIIIISALLFILFDSLLSIGIYNNTNQGIFNTIIMLIIPSITKNILLTNITLKAGFKPTILYRCLIELPIYILPIYSDLGEYIDSIFQIIFPLILLLHIITNYKNKYKQDIREITKQQKISLIATSIITIFLSILIVLVSGYYKYYLVVVASGSMEPNINIGDVVLVEKLKKNNYNKMKQGEVLVYSHDKKIIVHRIESIKKIGKEYIIRTKGDNNKSADNWLVYNKQIIGIARSRIRYVGYPTVLLNKILSE